MSIHKNSREQARLQHISVNFTGGLERALFAPKTSPRHYAAAIRIKDVVQFSKNLRPQSLALNRARAFLFLRGVVASESKRQAVDAISSVF